MSDAQATPSQRLLWVPSDEPGIEDVTVEQSGRAITMTSLLARLWEGVPLRASYTITCDADWRVRELRLTASSEATGDHSLHLLADGAGAWQDASGQPLSALHGCIDIDIMLTPLTNTLPIRRLDLAPSESREITVVYIAAPDFSVRPFAQRYTRLEDAAGHAQYRYESLDSGYTAVLPVDDAGFVIEYPGVWRRIWPRL